ncbi:MAG: NERD domain-containing protein [Candidatus Brockarchaeota archaeon]|nr:NERD domain-containing protein [Candidatus Brockarchaeota archaeon]
MPEEPNIVGLNLLRRLLERGFIISRGEAEEYGDYLKLLLVKGVMVEDKECFKAFPECCLLLLQNLVESGVRLETVLKSVNWRRFERVVAEVFRLHGFKVQEHFRFHVGNTRREIDLLVETPLFFISIDCKQWVSRNYNLHSACRLQFERSLLLAKYLAEKGVRKKICPLVVTFLESEIKILNNCSVVPVWKIGEVAEAPEVLRTLGRPVPLS